MKNTPKKFYAVYERGFCVYTHNDITSCLRWIAKKLGGVMGTVTMKQAMDVGFEIKSV